MQKTRMTFTNGMTHVLFIDTAQLEIGRWVTVPAPTGRFVLGQLVEWEVVG
ncbi:hypothetical protein [Atopococcus tabaci]|uniref:hypothetical protein n=1 Tax=Atopococcus tabaci TaxID=269774 RepID=UPI0024096E78|nr:hypothetical protein [Atopococcus tabaci]